MERQVIHILKPPRSGKTSEIIRKATENDLIIAKSDHLRHIKRYYSVDRNYTEVGCLLIGRNYRQYEKIYVDELLSFNINDLNWLNNLFERINVHAEIIAYSTPEKKFRKEAYLLARLTGDSGILFYDDPLLSTEALEKIKEEINILNDYYLVPGRNVTVIKNKVVFPEISFSNQEPLCEQERILGTERYDIMYNLNILK